MEKEKKIIAICNTIQNIKLKRDAEKDAYYKSMYNERIKFFDNMLKDIDLGNK